ncbi:MAG: CDP-glucose 4,6-dehydratase [Planctomycetes bacterium]|nr:CDP-glucose 4,6-dehydratase [Planctomycetota bacterium]
MEAAFWRDRRVLVTGHTGFKGSWLALWLRRLGAHVVGYALDPPTQPSLFEDARVGTDVTDLRAEIGDGARIAGVLAEHAIEVVFHLAAQPLVRRSYAAPAETFAVNVMGTVQLLDAVRAAPSVRSVVVVTSDKCYENRESIWGYREEDPVGGHDPYSASKACAELVTAAYRRSFFREDGRTIGVATVRAGNVLGGGDWAEDRLVPDLIRALARHEPPRIRNPRAVRPWQHVLEPLRGYLMVARRLHGQPRVWDSAWNFGPDASDEVPVAEIVAEVASRWGGSHRIDSATGAAPHEARWLHLDTSKARRVLGWTPRLDFSSAIEWTVEWYRRVVRDGEDAREVTLEQIAEYESCIRPGMTWSCGIGASS